VAYSTGLKKSLRCFFPWPEEQVKKKLTTTHSCIQAGAFTHGPGLLPHVRMTTPSANRQWLSELLRSDPRS
jgi:hypothetical protein